MKPELTVLLGASSCEHGCNVCVELFSDKFSQ